MGSKKKKPISDDDFLDECIKANEECYHTSCNRSIKLIKLKCHLCTQNFCTQHILPEVHGCGGAARKEAAAPPKKHINVEKHHQLENKLSKKLETMKNERKKKGK